LYHSKFLNSANDGTGFCTASTTMPNIIVPTRKEIKEDSQGFFTSLLSWVFMADWMVIVMPQIKDIR